MTTSLIGKGKAFGLLPKPETIEPVVIHADVGPITAIHQPSMTGESKGTVLFVPGFTGSKEDFYDLFPLLGEYGWDVWAISQRGQGDSVAPEGRAEYTREKTAGDVVEIAQIIAQAQGVDRVHLLGHSFGGTVAQAALIEKTIIFDSLTLMCSGPHGWPGRKADLLDSRYEIIPNAFHCPNGENPKPTAALLNDFWTSVTKDKSND